MLANWIFWWSIDGQRRKGHEARKLRSEWNTLCGSRSPWWVFLTVHIGHVVAYATKQGGMRGSVWFVDQGRSNIRPRKRALSVTSWRQILSERPNIGKATLLRLTDWSQRCREDHWSPTWVERYDTPQTWHIRIISSKANSTRDLIWKKIVPGRDNIPPCTPASGPIQSTSWEIISKNHKINNSPSDKNYAASYDGTAEESNVRLIEMIRNISNILDEMRKTLENEQKRHIQHLPEGHKSRTSRGRWYHSSVIAHAVAANVLSRPSVWPRPSWAPRLFSNPPRKSHGRCAIPNR